MSLVKISELPPSTGIFPDYDVLPIVHGGVTVKITAQSMTDTSLVSPGPIGVGTPSTIAATSISSVGDATIAGFTVGKGTASISTNTVFGYHGLHVNTTGSNNTAISSQALYTNTTGSNNTAVGSASLSNNTTGANNTALGVISLSSATTGSSNIGIGYGAGSSVTTGSNNTIIGNLTGTTALSSTVLIGAGNVERLKVNSTGLYINGSLFTGGGGSGTPVAVYGGFDNILTSTLASVNFIGEHGLVYNSFDLTATVDTISNSILGSASLTFDNSSAGNDNYWTLSLPWDVNYFGETYNTLYVGTNSDITFGTGSSDSWFAALAPHSPKILIASADNSSLGIFHGIEGTSPNQTYRIRYGGYTSLSGPLPITSSTVTLIPSLILGPAALTEVAGVDFTSGDDDDGFYSLTLPWGFEYFGTVYTTLYVGANSYITFVDGSTEYYPLNATNPSLPKIFIDADDYSVSRIFYGVEGTSPNQTYRIRFQGNQERFSGVEDLLWEATLYENDPTKIDIQVDTYDYGDGYIPPAISGNGVSGIYTDSSFVASILESPSDWGDSITTSMSLPAADIEWEATLYENDPTKIDIQIGNNTRLDGTSGVYTSEVKYADLSVLPNTGSTITTLKSTIPNSVTVDSTIRFNELNNLSIGGGLNLSTTGDKNISLGLAALYSNIRGYNNIALGQNTLKLGVACHDNISVGVNAGELSTGYNNIAIGSNSMSSVSTFDIVQSYTITDNTAWWSDGVHWWRNIIYVSGDLPINFVGGPYDTNGLMAIVTIEGGVVTSIIPHMSYGNPYWLSGQGIGTVFRVNTGEGTAYFEVASTVPYGSNMASGVIITDVGSGLADGHYTDMETVVVSGNQPDDTPYVNIVVSGGQVTSVEVSWRGKGIDPTATYSIINWGVGDDYTYWNCEFKFDVASTKDNVAIGSDTLQKTSGKWNVALGHRALQNNVSGEWNMAIGCGALNQNTSGYNNIAIGDEALWSNTDGYQNIAIGSEALDFNTTGYNNIATGDQALFWNTTGNNNIATGVSALNNNTTGNGNIATGLNALVNNETGSNNIATGTEALFNNTTGFENIATGVGALYFNTTGSENIATGTEALYWNTTGYDNIATGLYALFQNTTGDNNTATGAYALFSNTTGGENTATGVEALYYNTTGNYNIATGHHSLFYNTNGEGNIATGSHALNHNTTGNYNIATGHQSLYFNTTGYNNIATGRNTLLYNETGYENVATGHYALYHNTTGYANIAIGVDTLFSNTTGNSNIATGTDALYYNTTGSENIALGYNALYSNTTGYNNIATGPYALYLNTTGSLNIATGSDALWNNTTGTNNIATGGNALYNNTTGSYNVGIGIGVSSSSTTVSNEVNISNNTVTARFQGAASGWSFVSDQRDKTNVEDLTLGLDFINELRPRKFEWDLRHTDVDKGKVASGFIAQEVLAVVESNNAEYSRLVDTNDENQYTIAQTNLIPILVNAIKELTTEIEILKSKIDTLIP